MKNLGRVQALSFFGMIASAILMGLLCDDNVTFEHIKSFQGISLIAVAFSGTVFFILLFSNSTPESESEEVKGMRKELVKFEIIKKVFLHINLPEDFEMEEAEEMLRMCLDEGEMESERDDLWKLNALRMVFLSILLNGAKDCPPADEDYDFVEESTQCNTELEDKLLSIGKTIGDLDEFVRGIPVGGASINELEAVRNLTKRLSDMVHG